MLCSVDAKYDLIASLKCINACRAKRDLEK